MSINKLGAAAFALGLTESMMPTQAAAADMVVASLEPVQTQIQTQVQTAVEELQILPELRTPEMLKYYLGEFDRANKMNFLSKMEEALKGMADTAPISKTSNVLYRDSVKTLIWEGEYIVVSSGDERIDGLRFIKQSEPQ